MPGDPDARIVLDAGPRARVLGHHDQALEDLARPLSPRDRGDGGRAGAGRVRLAGRGGELRDRVLAARALQARAGAGSGRAAGQGRAGHRRRRAASGGRSSTRWHRPARAWWRSTSTRRGAREGGRRLRRPRARGRRRRDRPRRRWPTRSPPRSRRSAGVDIVVSNAGIASSAAIEDTTLAEWNRNHAILGTGYFLVAREAFRVLKAQGSGGSVVFVASKNSVVAGKNAAAYSSAKAAELHLARCLAEEGGGGRHPRQHRQPGRRPAGLEDLGLVMARGARGRLQHRARGARRALPPAQHAGVNIFPEDIAQAVLHFASERRSGKSTGNILNVDGGVPAAYAASRRPAGPRRWPAAVPSPLWAPRGRAPWKPP